MSNATFVSFGSLLLRKLIRRSRIFDFWRGDLRGEAPVHCLVRRVLPPYNQSEEYVGTFLERAREVQRQRLPGMLPVLETGDVDGIPYAVLESVRGWTLQTLIDVQQARGQSLPIDVALQLVLPVAQVLATAHAQSPPLVHGAIRPRSIWVATDGTVRLGDLEVGALAEIDLTSSEGQEERSWRFQAPERPEQWAQPAPAVDVFAVGALLLELLAPGRLSPVQVKLDAHDQLPLLREKEVPGALIDLIDTCHAGDPEARPAIAEVVRVLLEASQNQPASIPLAAHLAKHAPPIEELDPFLKVDPAGDRYLKNAPSKAKQDVKRTGPTAAGLEPAAPAASHRTRWVMVTLALLLVALTAGLVFRKELMLLVFGSSSNRVVVVVGSTPPGADITTAEGKALGRAPLRVPLTIDTDGTIGLIARLEGWQTEGPVRKEAFPGGELVFAFQMRPRIEGPADARIISDPPGAKLTVDGKARGVAPLLVEDLDSAEEHRVSATLNGYATNTVTFRVEVGRETEVKIGLERRAATAKSAARPAQGAGGGTAPVAASAPPPDPVDPGIRSYEGPVGYLILESDPWATVTIDGEERGRTSTGRKTPVAVGRHQIRYQSWDRKREVTRDVSVRKDETQVLEYDFKNGGWRLAPYRPF